MEATTGYARLGDARIAYQVVGGGPIDLVITPGSFLSFDVAGEDPTVVHRCEQVLKLGQSWTKPAPRARTGMSQPSRHADADGAPDRRPALRVTRATDPGTAAKVAGLGDCRPAERPIPQRRKLDSEFGVRQLEYPLGTSQVPERMLAQVDEFTAGRQGAGQELTGTARYEHLTSVTRLE